MISKYDFPFLLIPFFIILLVIVIPSFLLYYNIKLINNDIVSIKSNITEIAEKQSYPNFIQHNHNNISYILTEKGFFVEGVQDFGTLKGASMEPTIQTGHTLLLIKYSPEMNLTPGQIIRYVDEKNTSVIHRILAVYDDKLFVRGDNYPTGEMISKNQVMDVVLGVLYT